MRNRKIPLRKCVGCQEMFPKKQLIRIVRAPDAEVLIDLTGKMPGRGAYVCGQSACMLKMPKKRALDRALNVKVQQSVYEQLTQHAQNEDAQQDMEPRVHDE